jgi:hypothetical protein
MHIFRHRKSSDYEPHAAILATRLEEQRKTQLRMMKEQDAADSDLFDKVEEYQRDFDDRS